LEFVFDLSKVDKEVFHFDLRYELIGECHLWFDLRRRGWDYLKAFLESHNNSSSWNAARQDVKYPIDSRLMLLPIPQIELNQNPMITTADQNPGY